MAMGGGGVRRGGRRHGGCADGSSRPGRRSGPALLTSLALLLGISWGSHPAYALWPFGGDERPDPVADLRDAASSLLAEAIRIDTTNPPGAEAALAELYVEVLEQNGVEARVVETPSAPDVSRALAWGRVRGRGDAPPLVLLSHLDVVPAQAEEWGVPPFAGMVSAGQVVGRGALDAKGVGVMHLLTLVHLARRAEPLARDVIFLATPDEETGGRQGSRWVTQARPDLLHDAEYLLTEGGGVLVGSDRSPPVWGVAVAEKSPCWMRVVARGTPGHSAAPTRDAAVPRLVAALDRVRRLETAVRVIPEVARMFAALAPHVSPEDRWGYAHLETALSVDPLFRGRFLSDGARAALVRDTVTITVLEGSPRTNLLPAESRAHLDARLLPGGRCSDFANRIRAAVADPGVRVEPFLSFPARSSPADTPLFDAIRRTAAERDPGAVVVPRVIAGFNDAHYYRELGIVAYGFVPRWLSPADTRGIHGPDERISVDNLERGVHTLLAILERLEP